MFVSVQLMEEKKKKIEFHETIHENDFNAYGNSTRHFHPDIQTFLNSGNDQRCRTYQRIDIDLLDM